MLSRKDAKKTDKKTKERKSHLISAPLFSY